MEIRLMRAGITDMEKLLATQPKQLRKLWRSVTGERMWYALHGYAVQAGTSERGMFGHGRVLGPEWRTPDKAENCSRLLLMKAARRMRRERYAARKLMLWLGLRGGGWSSLHTLPSVSDDHSCLAALKALWRQARRQLPARAQIIRVGVTLMDLVSAAERQLDLLMDDDRECQRWETVTQTIDGLNLKFGKRVVTLGPWASPGAFAGGKIAFTRIPSAEDFW